MKRSMNRLVRRPAGQSGASSFTSSAPPRAHAFVTRMIFSRPVTLFMFSEMHEIPGQRGRA